MSRFQKTIHNVFIINTKCNILNIFHKTPLYLMINKKEELNLYRWMRILKTQLYNGFIELEKDEFL